MMYKLELWLPLFGYMDRRHDENREKRKHL